MMTSQDSNVEKESDVAGSQSNQSSYQYYPIQSLKSKTIVLDLDLTVVHTTLDCACRNHTEMEFEYVPVGPTDPSSPPPVKIGKSYVHIRPFAFKFIERCLKEGCEFVVFSANRKPYVVKVVDILFKDFEKPVHILTEQDLIVDPKTQFYVKTLETVSQKTGIPIDRLVAIDDNIYMYPNDTNVIRIAPWYNNVLLEDDDELLKMVDRLLG